MAVVFWGVAASSAQANQPPVAEAGPSRYVGAAPLMLDASRSSDPDPGDAIVSYAWTQLSGPTLSIAGANTARPTVTATPVSNVVATAILQLVAGDGEVFSAPDTVQLTIVPSVPASIQLTLENPPFDVTKPTAVFFHGGNCNTGGGGWGLGPDWGARANIISFVYGTPYERAGDALIAYLSGVAPEYDRPIQTAGFSTGGMPAIDGAIRINKIYKDPRYAINIVNLLDGACRNYDANILDYISNPVGDETAWVQNFFSATAGYATFRPRALNVRMVGEHGLPPNYYVASIYQELLTTDFYNHGMVAGVFTSVLDHGANYRMPNLSASPYYFSLVFDTASTVHLEQYNVAAYPGRLPQPVILTAPADGQVVPVTGVTLGCAPSENAVAYDLFLGTGSNRPAILLSFGSPVGMSTGFLPPDTHFRWTVQARDAYGTSHRADVRSFVTAPGLKVDVNGDGVVDAADCSIVHAAFGSTWGNPNFHPAADYEGDGVIDCADYYAWLRDYRTYYGDPARPDPCGFTDGPDTDGDGVMDSCDHCPGTVRAAGVDVRGCPPAVPGDFDRDGDVDQSDFGHLQACLTGPFGIQNEAACQDAKLDDDPDVDDQDFMRFHACHTSASIPAAPDCGG